MGQSGFTLTEVLITLIVLAILASVALANYARTVQRARFDAAEQVLMQIYQGEQTYLAINDQFVSMTCASPLTDWRNQLSMDHPCPGATPTVTYAVGAAGTGSTATFQVLATSGSNTRQIDQNRVLSGTGDWTNRP